MQYIRMKSFQYIDDLLNTVATDGMMFKHNGISGNNVDYAHMRFQLFMGKSNCQ